MIGINISKALVMYQFADDYANEINTKLTFAKKFWTPNTIYGTLAQLTNMPVNRA